MNMEMAGYDKKAALEYILGAIDMKAHRLLKADMPRLLAAIIDADIAYMHISGTLDETGDTGEGFYDEDDAFEYILSLLARKENADEKKEEALASLINDFMPAQSRFMEFSGLAIIDQT